MAGGKKMKKIDEIVGNAGALLNKTWRVAVEAICLDNRSVPIYVDGNAIPQRIVSSYPIYVVAHTLQQARERVKKIIARRYDEYFERIDFINTEEVSPTVARSLRQDLPGLRLRR